jgi:small subunit ribosomal protein S8e
MLSNKRAKRKASGGRYGRLSRITANKSSLPTHTKLGENKVKPVRARGGIEKSRLLTANKVNVVDGKKAKVATITNVIETPANRHLVRRNVLTKGAVVETDMGKVRITSRPGQEAMINGVLVK